MDKVTMSRIETLHPDRREEALLIYKECFERLNSSIWGVRFASYRSNKEQDELYALGRTKVGVIVTYAKGGESYHNYGLAIDICLIGQNGNTGASWDLNVDGDKDGVPDWLEVVAVFQKYGWIWGLKNAAGKRWDFPHFQKDDGFSIVQLQQKIKAGGLINVIVDKGIVYPKLKK